MWTVYIIRCADNTLYTGIARDVESRLAQHNSGKAAKYTRSRLPVELVYREDAADRSAALKREHTIKKFTTEEKRALFE